jgi:hypothetical protein
MTMGPFVFCSRKNALELVHSFSGMQFQIGWEGLSGLRVTEKQGCSTADSDGKIVFDRPFGIPRQAGE